MLSSNLKQRKVNTMDSFQDGGHKLMNTEHNNFSQGMEGSYMNPEMTHYGPNPGEQGMGPDSYGRMNEGIAHGQMSQYNPYNRSAYPGMDNGMGNEYSSHSTAYGQYQQPGSRGSFPGGPRPPMGPVRPGAGAHSGGMIPGPGAYNSNQQRMLSGQTISQQSGPTPTLNQLLQTPNSQPRYQNNYEGYQGPQKGPEISASNGPYGMPQGWIQNQRGMGNYPPMSMSGSSPYRGQGQQSYNQQGFNQPPNSQSQYSSQGSIQQQPQPPGQPPGSSPQQQRPTPQPSPHQQISPAPSPSPAHRLTPNPSPGPQRPQPQPSPGQQRPSQPSPSPSQRSSSSQLSPPGSSPGQQNLLPNSQHNHLSSPKESSTEDVKGEGTPMSNSSRPEPSPGSVSSRSNTPASISGASPMPPRPSSQQDGSQQNSRMSQSPMPATGYNQQMMPPPMGPNQMGGYNPGSKMAAGQQGSYNHHYQNSQYPQSGGGNFPMRHPAPGMGNYPQNMYNGPSQMGPGGQPMYNSMSGPGMGRNNYNNMYSGQGGMMGINNQYGNYSGPGQTPQSGPAPGMSSPGPSANGPQANVNSMAGTSSGSNGPMSGPPVQGPTPIKGAQAAAQAAMAAANAAARSQPSPGRPSQPQQRAYNPNMPVGPHSMPPQSMSPLSHMGQMNQMGYNSTNSLSPHPQNSVSPVPPNVMGQNMPPSGKMHNSSSVNNYNSEQPLPKSKSKSKSVTNTNLPPTNIPNSLRNSTASPHMGMASPSMQDPNMQPHQPVSTPASTLSDAGSHSNDSTSMGPVMNNDSNATLHSASGPNGMPASGAPDMPQSVPSGETGQSQSENESNTTLPNDALHPITTQANTTSVVETTTTVTQSITSPVTSLSTEAGNSNDSQPVPMEPLPAMQNCIPTPQSIGEPENSNEPPEKKRKTDNTGISQLPFARVAPSPGGASVASSGTHEDIDNVGSPSGWSSSAKSGSGDHMKLYEMGMEPGRRPFLERLFAYLDEKGTPMSNMPVISKQPIDLFRLYMIVQEKGGMVEVTKAKKWKEICGLINVSGSASAAFTLKKNYIKFLFAFECRYDRGGMDPAPILAQMENDLEKKRAAKQRNRAPSPGSQGSQDGMPGQFIQNDPSMGHMGQGMMGNHMMNNMGPHGAPMMGPNNMGGPHHMGPGMQGPGHMMGSMGHQNYPNSNYMMQGGPNSMMGNNMGPQGGMMAAGMQGPNGMMGPGGMGPQQGSMMPNSMGQQTMMNNMNMPANSMMPHNSMGPAGNMSGHQPGMMPPNSMNQQQMMRNNIGHSPGPNSGPMMPPNSMMRGNSDSVSCQDPFADEPYQKQNSGPQMPPYNTIQQNSAIPQSNSPMPPNSGPMPSQNSNMPPSSNTAPVNQIGMNQQPHTPQSIKPEISTNSGTAQSNTEMPATSSMMPQSSGISLQSTVSDTFSTMTTASISTSTNSSTVSQSNMFSQDSNSNSSMPETAAPQSMAPQSVPGQPPVAQPVMSHASSVPQQMPGQPPMAQPMMSHSNSMPPQMPGQPPMMSQPMMSHSNSMPPQMPGQPQMSHSSSMPPHMPGQPSMSSQPMMPHSHAMPPSMPGQPQMSSQSVMSQPSSMPQDGPANSSSQYSATTNTTSSSGRQFPFGDNQFSKPDRFDQASPNMSPANNPPLSQAGPSGVNPQQAPMNYPQQGMNQVPYGPHQHGVDPNYQGRYSSQGQPGPDGQFSQGYHGNTPQGGYGPRPPMMGGDQYQGYPNQGQYGKPPMPGGNIYTTPNKRYPDNRSEYMSPAYCSQPYGGSSSMNYGDPNTSHYQSTPQYNDYSDSTMTPDRRDQSQWSPMPQQRSFHGMPPYGPGQTPGMSPSGPPNMSHISRIRMSPTRNREYVMSPNNKQKMMPSSGMHGPYKKDMHFPIDTVESTQPHLSKRRKLTKHDVGPQGYKPVYTGSKRNRGSFSTGQIEAWRIMMALKSGLMAESTWALDTLNILLFDDSTVAYFGLAHLPGLLEVLLDHFRRCLIEMFDLFEDSQIGSGHEDFKQNLVRMAILETAMERNDELADIELKRVNKTLVKIENADITSEDLLDKKTEKSAEKKTDEKKNENGEDENDKTNETETYKEWKSRPNFTFITRQGKDVKFEENARPNGLLDEKFWDVYGEFGDQSDLWEIGKGDLTEHICTHVEDLNEIKRCSKRFFRKPMELKDPDEVQEKIENPEETEKDGAIKIEPMETDTINPGSVKEKDVESENQSNPENSDNEKCETSSNNTDYGSDKFTCEKDHTCNKFMKGVTIKTEPRDMLPDQTDSSSDISEEKLGAKSFFRDEPRMKLAVKYELLDSNELVQICKTQFGLNTEGERNNMEDESYQRNEPPLCLTSEAQQEIGRRCVCVSNIFRSLSYLPGNDIELSRHTGLLYILGKLLLLHHKHLPRSRVRRKFDRDDIDEDMVDTSQGIEEWWWDCLNVLRENTLVIFANICAQLRLDVFPDEICVPILDGLLHWVVCPSSCASDPLPTVGPSSVLSPLRLVLEALCKLCIHDKNVDMLLASPPYERIVQLFSVLTKLLANKSEQVTVEFSVVLLSELVKGGSSAARGVALQHPSISLLIDFVETAEQKAVQVANMHTVQMLRDNPEMMGTSLDMLRRAATVLLHLAKVPENRKLFVHHQSRILALVMSQILDHNVASILSDVLFQCSQLS
ncbi:trithorax group protein osa-like isoform X3 [Mercenaria mercenaria]|uniref:trithorax group protein osa-like isoform X3 n=1 Tax=Mercenaria mercenaria TaxID=6596 RepID=UPI00234E9609|nr:trithorax group protein osa-like isoform X3 [Mercenaria mercenaria]